MEVKPWELLDPNDFKTKWWRQSLILDSLKASLVKTNEESLAHLIIQDGNLGGNFWHLCSWYQNDPNRYNTTLYWFDWPFNKTLIDIDNNDIIFIKNNPEIKYIAKNCQFSDDYQQKYCKILERIHN